MSQEFLFQSPLSLPTAAEGCLLVRGLFSHLRKMPGVSQKVQPHRGRWRPSQVWLWACACSWRSGGPQAVRGRAGAGRSRPLGQGPFVHRELVSCSCPGLGLCGCGRPCLSLFVIPEKAYLGHTCCVGTILGFTLWLLDRRHRENSSSVNAEFGGSRVVSYRAGLVGVGRSPPRWYLPCGVN